MLNIKDQEIKYQLLQKRDYLGFKIDLFYKLAGALKNHIVSFR